MKQNNKTVFPAILFLWLLIIIFSGCQFEATIDRFGAQLLESMDNTPVVLKEVKQNIQLPDSLVCSDSLVEPMYPVYNPPPYYPDRLRNKGVEGRASILVVTDSTGKIINKQITYATDTSFAQSLMETVGDWKINTCRINGIPVGCYKIITIDFDLK